MIGLLISVLVLLLVFGVIFYIINLIPLPPPFGMIAQLVVGLIFLLILLNMVVGLPGVYGAPWHTPLLR